MPETEKIRRRPTAFSMPYQLIVLGMLILFSIVVAISSVGTYNISIDGARNLMEKRAMDIAVNIGITLDRFGFKEELFEELVRTERWRDLAFLSLYDHEGAVILHSNPKLLGREQKDEYVEKVIKEEAPAIHFSVLATGEEVFILDFPLQLHKRFLRLYRSAKKKIQEGLSQDKNEKVFCLRVAIHPYPANGIVRKANFQIFLAGFSLVILWVLAVFFFLAWRRGERLEIRLQEQERLAALGEMAAVLAHEIRNPLSSIKGFAQYHLEEAGLSPILKEDLGIIIEESKRLERLAFDLLAYARPAMPHEEKFELERFCKELVRSVVIPDDNVTLDFRCDQATVRFDKAKLMQIGINLLQNAIDAANEHGGQAGLNMKYVEEGIIMEVWDTGPGLSEAVRGRLFEPFVTTKARGTGLGLAIVKRLVESTGGTIVFKDRIKSEPAQGTLVEVVLPVSGLEDEL